MVLNDTLFLHKIRVNQFSYWVSPFKDVIMAKQDHVPLKHDLLCY